MLTNWRLAVRLFVKQPGLTAAAVAALALGMGLTVTLFSIGYGIFLRDLPVPYGDRIVGVLMANGATGQNRIGVSVHDFAELRDAQTSFEDFAAVHTCSLNVVVRGGQPERLAGAELSANGFAVLGVRPLLGRTFVEADGTPGAPRVLVLGHDVWQTRFGGDPGVVGRVVRANGREATIVGVMPKGFGFPNVEEAWMVEPIAPLAYPRGTGPAFIAYGRLKPGIGISQARADLRAVAARIARTYPASNRNLVPNVRPYTQLMSGDREATYNMIFVVGMALGVLLIACVNVANLLFARAASRTQELAIRSALGAGRRRIVLQLLTETVILAAAGTAAGLALAEAGIRFFNHAIAEHAGTPPFWIIVRLDAAALACAAGLTVIAAAASGLMPAWRASRSDVSAVLRDGSRSTSGLRIGWATRVLVTAEIVLSFGLLVTASLTTRSMMNLGGHDFGFATDDVFTARVVLPDDAYPDDGSRTRFTGQLQARLSSLRGVSSATLVSSFPGVGSSETVVVLDSTPLPDTSQAPVVRFAAIGDRFFETFGRSILRGREFRASDTASALPVAIVNESFARRMTDQRDPIGQRVRLESDPSASWRTIVGVAPDLYMSGPLDLEPAGVYIPMAQSDQPRLGLALRGGGSGSLAADVRAQVSALDPDLPVFSPKVLRQRIDEAEWPYAVFGPLMVATGVAALFLATVGLYSLMAFAVRQRLPEIAMRLALGARSKDIARLIAGEVASQVGIGLVIGGAFGAVLSVAMRSMVFHVAPHDPVTYATVVVSLVLAAALAAFVPVRRAVRVDPTTTLREQ